MHSTLLYEPEHILCSHSTVLYEPEHILCSYYSMQMLV